MQQLNSYEKRWLENGINQGRAQSEKLIEFAVRMKFGSDAVLSVMPAIRSMDASRFDRVVRALELATSPAELLRDSAGQE